MEPNDLLHSKRRIENYECDLKILDEKSKGITIQCVIANEPEIFLKLSEKQLLSAGLSRQNESLEILMKSLTINKIGSKLNLESTNKYLKISETANSCESVEELMLTRASNGDSLQQILLNGLVELCRAKPSGEAAISSLGEWLIANNPNKPNIVEQ